MGTILTGVFAFAAINGASGLFAGNVHQFFVQIAGVVIAAVYAFVVTYLILKAVNLLVPVRVSEEVEARGLDEVLHGEPAYQPMPVTPVTPVALGTPAGVAVASEQRADSALEP